jgi:hypothetical protein
VDVIGTIWIGGNLGTIGQPGASIIVSDSVSGTIVIDGTAENGGEIVIGDADGDVLSGTVTIGSGSNGKFCDVTVYDAEDSTGTLSAGLKNENATFSKGTVAVNVTFEKRAAPYQSNNNWSTLFGYDPIVESASSSSPGESGWGDYAAADPINWAYLYEAWLSDASGMVDEQIDLDGPREAPIVSGMSAVTGGESWSFDGDMLLSGSGEAARLSEAGILLWGGYVEIERLDRVYLDGGVPNVLGDSIGSAAVDPVFVKV